MRGGKKKTTKRIHQTQKILPSATIPADTRDKTKKGINYNNEYIEKNHVNNYHF